MDIIKVGISYIYLWNEEYNQINIPKSEIDFNLPTGEPDMHAFCRAPSALPQFQRHLSFAQIGIGWAAIAHGTGKKEVRSSAVLFRDLWHCFRHNCHIRDCHDDDFATTDTVFSSAHVIGIAICCNV